MSTSINPAQLYVDRRRAALQGQENPDDEDAGYPICPECGGSGQCLSGPLYRCLRCGALFVTDDATDAQGKPTSADRACTIRAGRNAAYRAWAAQEAKRRASQRTPTKTRATT
ncbi:hypothetical protein AGMMS50256_30720 [Betaproteobacteria bacterium]|nr:hypothetical protein AGMMS50256_30720 [Betaproteobacteria bacterium]